jgi:type VI secretion system protein ImpA
MLDLESLISSLGEAAPSGEDLEYDADFAALEQAGAGKPEQQYGDTIIPAEAPDWRTVHELASGLAQRTRDLRVAVWLLRSEARLHGLAAAARALRLLHGLLDTQWDTVHPQLDASDGNDPTMRMNALAPLVAAGSVLADLRAATLAPERGSLTVRELELGLGKAEPHGDESAPSEAGALQALEAILAQHADLAAEITATQEALRGMARLLDDKVGSLAPELTPLQRLLKTVDDGIRRARGDASADDSTASEGDAGPGTPAGGAPVRGAIAVPGSINSRDDAMRMLEKVCEWVERHEPSHPAPLLIRRAHRLMGMSFVEIMRNMAPDGMGQVQMIAGPDSGIEY